MLEDRYLRLKEVLEKRQPTLTVLMENVHKLHNYAAVLRSCDAVGVESAHAVSSVTVGQRLSKKNIMRSDSSASAAKWVDIEIHEDAKEAVIRLKSRGFSVVAAHLSERAVDYRSIDYTKPTCILLGAEKFGVSEIAAEIVDTHIMLPMLGMVESLNVSVAASLILFEAQSQRLKEGMYATPQIEEGRLNDKLFSWLYPVIAEQCRLNDLPYPTIDAQGEMVQDYRTGKPFKRGGLPV